MGENQMIIECPYCKQELDTGGNETAYRKLPFYLRVLQWITLGIYKAAKEKYKLSLNMRCRACQKIFVLKEGGITQKNKADLNKEAIEKSLKVLASHY